MGVVPEVAGGRQGHTEKPENFLKEEEAGGRVPGLLGSGETLAAQRIMQ